MAKNIINYSLSQERVGYNELKGSLRDPSGVSISLDEILNKTEKITQSQEGIGPAEAWLMSGINRKKGK